MALIGVINPEFMPRAFALIAINKMMILLKYFDTGPIADVEVFYMQFDTRNMLNLGIPAPNDLQSNMTRENIPSSFKLHGLHSRFLINYWPTLSTIIIIASITTFLYFMVGIADKQKFKGMFKICYQFKQLIRWNLLLTIFLLNVDENIISTGLEFQNLNSYSFKTWLGYILAIVFIVIYLWHIIRNIFLVRKYLLTKRNPPRLEELETNKKLRKYIKIWDNYKIIYAGLDTNSGYQLMFTVTILVRLAIAGILISYAYREPTLQAVIMLIISIASVFYILTKNPFVDFYVRLEIIFYECLLLMILVATITMTVSASSKGDGEYQKFESASMAIKIFHLFYCILGFIFTVRLFYKAITKKATSGDLQNQSGKRCQLLRSFFANAPKTLKEANTMRFNLFFKSIFNHNDRKEENITSNYRSRENQNEPKVKPNQIMPVSTNVYSRTDTDRKLRESYNTPTNSMLKVNGKPVVPKFYLPTSS
mmetsp:Transcript_4842/g.4032  ORF Transcript_4842/g.4032 Transcript_4842/m.4032 type:complete len:480 (+) Transcript_4842:924-2363(+)|eukprot:CAMPEP_0114576460 /NCGR_PEP_ID=MMETSP0125-20121206/1220_1 /TAXON_ID=485358 ORGANISM="Aristerostoma sp., Strain ATCC 50986" /NCGR_SAMPLE_ID=MMETSP0125 /ASSEMBLY_ACC=CAM_ASM_000245 /LENGTH=479 /DNA_ID=CAMNT_0001764993 /DNA_START=897 /DNA_END=2336 /DNA_ORIENTATION=-